ncbi:MAG: hypothetical protein PHU04_04650 [Candidatus Peribacteraceae bacterium]|nr:hypothetical protein [Candidatus Peribacteraceae bacterium]
MLTEAEQQIVDENKVWGFGAYMQCAFFDYEYWNKAHKENQLPGNDLLQKIFDGMERMKSAFDITYLVGNTDLRILTSEKEAWSLLSDRIGNFLERLKDFLEQSNDEPQDQSVLSKQLYSEFWELLQKWNVISNAYKKKYERCYDDIPHAEENLRALIDRLRTAANTACAAQAGSILNSDEGRQTSPKSPVG